MVRLRCPPQFTLPNDAKSLRIYGFNLAPKEVVREILTAVELERLAEKQFSLSAAYRHA
jgi:hypothetical protein